MKAKKTTYLKLAVIVMVPLLLSGCLNELFDDGEITYDVDDPKVELVPRSLSYTLPATVAGTTPVTAQLIGEQRSEPTTFNISVVDSLTTAEEGVQYSLTTTSVTIPADSSSASYSFIISGEGLQAGEDARVTIRVEGTEDVDAADNLAIHTVFIQGGGS